MTQRFPHPLPTSANPSAAYQDVAEIPPLVRAFLDRLRRLPLGEWVDAGRSLEALDRRGTLGATPSASTLRSQLRQTVNAMPVLARQVRARVLDLAAVAQGFVHPAEAARMKRAALAAALALAARPSLATEHFVVLYEPFAVLIPIASLQHVDLPGVTDAGAVPGGHGPADGD